jgi:D-beta-D-heptose 7-phosphate kinase/D-beta-D-heptose 1-phosphate adenosyltransferase
VVAKLPELLSRVDIAAISDYGKGFLTPALLQRVIGEANTRNIPVIVDPKGFDYRRYSGADIIKPNLSETYAAAGVDTDAPLETAVEKILSAVDVKTLMVTRASQGISLFHASGSREDFPVRVREVKDVTGAGDTVLAMLTVAVASGLTLADAAQLCNIAAGIALEKVGCARVTLSQLAMRLLEIDGANKVFTRDHQDVLQLALQGQKLNILNLPDTDALTADLYKSIKAQAQPLIISLKDPHPEFVNILSSLKEVHSILLN